MAEKALGQILGQLRTAPPQSYPKSSDLLSRAKLHLHALSALSPSPQTPPHILPLAREVYELGALLAIRAIGHLSSLPDAPAKLHDTIAAVREAFLRNVTQLRPFYDLPASSLYPDGGKNAAAERNKVMGLYLLLLLTEGKYAEFHSEFETLTVREEGTGWAVESDKFLAYPVRLERWLMEGSYDRVWKAMKSREVPCEEYGVFSDILTQQIRSEIASSSERAYPKLPLGSTKSLLFLESEGAVISFARQRGWIVRDGEIFFPIQDATATIGDEGDAAAEKEVSQMIIENALGYARELETIV